MNKKGSKVLAVYWFAILIIVAIGIYAMVAAYYSHPTDVRTWEAEILANKVADCISRQGKLNIKLVDNSEFNDNFKENFLNECDLNLNSEWDDKTQYYIEVDFFTIDNTEEAFFVISVGDSTWKEQYKIQENKEFATLVKGVEKRLYASDNQENQFLVKILTIVRKTEKNVKV